MVVLQIEQAAHPRAHLIIEKRLSLGLRSTAIKTSSAFAAGRADGEQTGAVETGPSSRCIFASGVDAGCREPAAQKEAQNSVHFPSERTSLSSPPCRRASSRARFKPKSVSGTSSARARTMKALKNIRLFFDRDAAAGVGHSQLNLDLLLGARRFGWSRRAGCICGRYREGFARPARRNFASPAICKSGPGYRFPREIGSSPASPGDHRSIPRRGASGRPCAEFKRNLPGIHPREQQKILDHTRQPVGLMDEVTKFPRRLPAKIPRGRAVNRAPRAGP